MAVEHRLLIWGNAFIHIFSFFTFDVFSPVLFNLWLQCSLQRETEGKRTVSSIYHFRAFVHLCLSTPSFSHLYDGSVLSSSWCRWEGQTTVTVKHIKVTDFFPIQGVRSAKADEHCQRQDAASPLQLTRSWVGLLTHSGYALWALSAHKRCPPSKGRHEVSCRVCRRVYRS